MSKTNNPIAAASLTDARGLRQTLIALGVIAAIVSLTACGSGDKAPAVEKAATQKVEANGGEHSEKDGLPRHRPNWATWYVPVRRWRHSTA